MSDDIYVELKKFQTEHKVGPGSAQAVVQGERPVVTVTSSGQVVHSVREILFSDARRNASKTFEQALKKAR